MGDKTIKGHHTIDSFFMLFYAHNVTTAYLVVGKIEVFYSTVCTYVCTYVQ